MFRKTTKQLRFIAMAQRYIANWRSRLSAYCQSSSRSLASLFAGYNVSLNAPSRARAWPFICALVLKSKHNDRIAKQEVQERTTARLPTFQKIHTISFHFIIEWHNSSPGAYKNGRNFQQSYIYTFPANPGAVLPLYFPQSRSRVITR